MSCLPLKISTLLSMPRRRLPSTSFFIALLLFLGVVSSAEAQFITVSGSGHFTNSVDLCSGFCNVPDLTVGTQFTFTVSYDTTVPPVVPNNWIFPVPPSKFVVAAGSHTFAAASCTADPVGELQIATLQPPAAGSFAAEVGCATPGITYPAGIGASVRFSLHLIGIGDLFPANILPTKFPPLSAYSTASFQLVIDRSFFGTLIINGILDTFLAPSPSPLVTTLFDPVPSLVQDGAVISNTSTLSSLLSTQGRVIKGVSADGVTAALIQITGAAPNDTLMLSVDQDGELADVQNPNFQSTTSVRADSSGVAFALYRAPLDFVRAGNSADLAGSVRTVHLAVQSGNNPGITSDTPISVLRPPVVLIHGVWSSPSTWDHFCPNALPVRPCEPVLDSRFHTYPVDYSGTSGEGFAVNAPLALAQILNFVEDFKTTFHAAAVQVDVVAHSMGGDISRQMVLIPPPVGFLRDTNYDKGDIHKLITIDTPHLGSEFANRLLKTSALCRAVFDQAGSPVAGAVRDLAIGSARLHALEQLSFPLKTHVVAGVADVTQQAVAEQNFRTLGLGQVRHICSGLLPAGGFEALFGGPNDLIVSETSQIGSSLAYQGGVLPSDISSSTIHTVIPNLFTQGPDALSRTIVGGKVVGVATTSPGLIIDLLNQPVGGSAFAPIRP